MLQKSNGTLIGFRPKSLVFDEENVSIKIQSSSSNFSSNKSDACYWISKYQSWTARCLSSPNDIFKTGYRLFTGANWSSILEWDFQAAERSSILRVYYYRYHFVFDHFWITNYFSSSKFRKTGYCTPLSLSLDKTKVSQLSQIPIHWFLYMFFLHILVVVRIKTKSFKSSSWIYFM